MRSATVHQPNQPIDFPRLCWNTRWWRVRGAQAAVQPRGPRSVLFERGNSVLLRHGSENPSCSGSQDLRGLERCTMCKCRPFLKSVESDQTEMCVHCTCDWVKLFVLCPNGNFTDERSQLFLLSFPLLPFPPALFMRPLPRHPKARPAGTQASMVRCAVDLLSLQNGILLHFYAADRHVATRRSSRAD